MRGDDNQQEGMFSYISPEKRVPADHPLRPIRKMVDEILKEMSPQFAKLYSEVGRPSIAPERLFRSLLLQIFYTHHAIARNGSPRSPKQACVAGRRSTTSSWTHCGRCASKYDEICWPKAGNTAR